MADKCKTVTLVCPKPIKVIKIAKKPVMIATLCKLGPPGPAGAPGQQGVPGQNDAESIVPSQVNVTIQPGNTEQVNAFSSVTFSAIDFFIGMKQGNKIRTQRVLVTKTETGESFTVYASTGDVLSYDLHIGDLSLSIENTGTEDIKASILEMTLRTF
jgi:hypothetical protein